MNSRKNLLRKYSKNEVRDWLLPGLWGQFTDVPDFEIEIQITDDGLLVGGWRKKQFLYFLITNKELETGAYKSQFSPRCVKLREELTA